MPACPRCGAEMPANAAADEVCTTCGAQEAAELRQALIYRPKIYLTNALILANVLMFLVMLTFAMTHGGVFGSRFLGIDLPQFDSRLLVVWGANWKPLSLGLQPWRLLTSTYLHGSLLHVATNMFCLWGLGRLAESFYSKVDFALAYTFTGIAGSLLSAVSVIYYPEAIVPRMFPLPSVGASGAVFGIAGLILATMRWGNVPLPKDVRNAVYKDVLRFSALNLVIGFLPHIDNMGHLGGLLSGVLLGTVLGKNLDRSSKAVRFRLIAWTILLALLAVAVWAAMAQYRRIVRGI